MMEMTIGAYMREKMMNMAAWLQKEGCDVPPFDVNETLLVAAAQTLHDTFDEAIRARNFDAMERGQLPGAFKEPLAFVRAHPDLHDKFWRYLTLFSDVVVS